jgi:hypothetical protein
MSLLSKFRAYDHQLVHSPILDRNKFCNRHSGSMRLFGPVVQLIYCAGHLLAHQGSPGHSINQGEINVGRELNVYFQGEGAGLIAAAMIAVVPGYISRSVAGSYDNEARTYF